MGPGTGTVTVTGRHTIQQNEAPRELCTQTRGHGYISKYIHIHRRCEMGIPLVSRGGHERQREGGQDTAPVSMP